MVSVLGSQDFKRCLQHCKEEAFLAFTAYFLEQCLGHSAGLLSGPALPKEDLPEAIHLLEHLDGRKGQLFAKYTKD